MRSVLLFIVLSGVLFVQPVYSQAARDGYVGVIAESDSNKVGSRITFANIRSASPFVTWPSGNGNPTSRVNEDDETVVLFFVASLTGGTETFYLNKKTLKFTVVEVSALEATATGTKYRPKVSYGRLE